MISKEKIGLEIAQFLGWDQSSHGEMVMRGNSLKAGLLSLATLFSASAAQAEPMAETLRFAVMRALPASDPEDGSVNPHAPINSPVASLLTYFFFCASLPARKM